MPFRTAPLVAALAILATLALAAPAHAGESAPIAAPTTTKPAQGEPYVGTMAAASILVLTSTAVSLHVAEEYEQGVPLGLSAVAYLFVVPAVHAVSGNSAPRTFASLGLHVALPFAGAVLANRGEDDDDTVVRYVFGGMIAASAIDLVMAAVPARPPSQNRGKHPGMVPTVGANGRGVSLGLAGSF